MTAVGRDLGIDKVELRARRDGDSMAWILTRRLAAVVAEELRAAGWAVSMDEQACD
jgi:hypothetical protein